MVLNKSCFTIDLKKGALIVACMMILSCLLFYYTMIINEIISKILNTVYTTIVCVASIIFGCLGEQYLWAVKLYVLVLLAMIPGDLVFGVLAFLVGTSQFPFAAGVALVVIKTLFNIYGVLVVYSFGKTLEEDREARQFSSWNLEVPA